MNFKLFLSGLLVVFIGIFVNVGVVMADTSSFVPNTPDLTGYYWVKFWNIGAESDDQNCVCGGSWDGRCCYDTDVTDGRVQFFYQDEHCWFSLDRVSADPRKTNWWITFYNDSATSLWAAVYLATARPDDSIVVSEIIDHMVQLGLVMVDEFENMTPARISEVMSAYTALSVPEIFAQK